MRCAASRDVEALVFGELEGARAEAARAHLAGCARCAEEAARLRAERALFTRRARVPAPAPPAFGEVLARARRADPVALRVARRGAPHVGLAMAAAVLALFVARRTPSPTRDGGAAPAIIAEPLGDLTCADMPSARALHEAERTIAGAEDAYRACLMSTPLALPSETDGELVTRGEVEPREGEACDEHTCEGSVQ